MTLGHTDEAIADFNKAIELQPDYPRAYPNRAMTLMKKGRFSAAFADYKRAGGNPKPLTVAVAGILILLALIAFFFLRAITRLACRRRRVPSG
jgi:Flp pilus assembly protein TadD